MRKLSKPQRRVMVVLRKNKHAIIRDDDFFYPPVYFIYDEISKKALLTFRRDTFEALLNMGAIMATGLSVRPKNYVIDPYFVFQ